MPTEQNAANLGPKAKVRSSNLELFRVVLTFLVIAHHLLYHLYGWNAEVFKEPLAFNSLFLYVSASFGRACNNCFILITGYFMCKSDITARKFLKLYATFVVCRLVVLFGLHVSGLERCGLENAAAAFLPFYQLKSNFFGCFFVFFLSLPFLKTLVSNLTERKHLALIALCAYPLVFCTNAPMFSATWGYCYWFVFIYFIGAYFRLYPKKIFENARITGATALGCLCLWFACVYVKTRLLTDSGAPFDSLEAPTYWVRESNLIVPLAASIAAFLFFKNVRFPQSKLVNFLGSTTFGVLVLHHAGIVVCENTVLTPDRALGAFHSAAFPIVVLGAIAAIFTACAVVETIRRSVVDKPLFRFYDEKLTVKRQ